VPQRIGLEIASELPFEHLDYFVLDVDQAHMGTGGAPIVRIGKQLHQGVDVQREALGGLLFSVGESPTRHLSLQPEAIRAVMEVTKWLKPPVQRVTLGDLGSVQAVT
jgi:hypothetical protein